jgi:hypothetical protein
MAHRKYCVVGGLAILAAATLTGEAFGDDVRLCVDKSGAMRVQDFPCDVKGGPVERQMIGRSNERPAAPQPDAKAQPRDPVWERTREAQGLGYLNEIGDAPAGDALNAPSGDRTPPGRNGDAPPPPPPSTASVLDAPPNALSSSTGQVYPMVPGGIVDPTNGQFYRDVGGAYMNPLTGQFIPKPTVPPTEQSE